MLSTHSYPQISVTFELLDYRHDVDAFWSSVGSELRIDKITSPTTLSAFFSSSKWNRSVVLLIDELSEISRASEAIRDDFLRTLRGIKHSSDSAIKSIVAAGTFSTIRLTTKDISLSPFNISDAVQPPYFVIEETRKLFKMFEQDYDITIESAVVMDIWEKSKGYA